MSYPLPNTMTLDDAKKLAEDLKNLTGVTLEISYSLAMIVEDPKVLKILDVLYGSAPKVKKREKSETYIIRSKNVPNLLEQSKSWALMNGNQVVEKYSIEEKSQMLVRGSFEEGARLRYEKNGKYFTVKGAFGKTQQLEG